MSEEEQIILPEGYTEVKWIYFNEQQYIKTNVFVTNNIGCKIKYTREKEFLGDEGTADHILGARSLTGGAGIDNCFNPPQPDNSGKFYCAYGKKYYTFNEECILYKPYEAELNYLNSSYASLNNKKIYIERESFVEDKWPKINPLILGGFTNDNQYPYGVYNWKGRVYYCIITDGDKIVRHYIPCLNENNTLCFYDLINKTTHFSDGQPFQNYGLKDDNIENEEKFILPNGYTKVEYLQSSNSTTGEYGIDTGIKPNDKIGFYIEFKSIYDVTTNYQQTVFGARYKDGDRELQITHYGNGMLDFGNQSISIPYILGTKYIFSLKDKTAISFNGNKIKLSTQRWECDYNIYLFCMNDAGTLKQGSAVKIYRFKLYDGKEIVRDFIPCLDDKSEPCMYDLIEKKPYYNVGDKQFAYPKNNDFSTPSLPEGFKKCAYLQSDGTQWIDTEYIPDSNTGLLVIAQRLNYGDYINFGSCTNTSSSYIYAPRYNTNSKYMVYGWNTNKAPYTYNIGDDLRYISSINIYNDKKAKIDSDDTDYETYLTSPLNEQLYSLWLFSYNIQGSFNETYGKWGGRIHRAQITQENKLVRDYIPCLDANGKPCMYDIISGVAYYNQGSGKDFEYCIDHKLPHDFSKLKWLESEGTQYIKTNYIPSNNTGLYIDTYHTGKKAEHGMPFAVRDTSSGNYVAIHRLMKSTDNTGYGWGGWTNVGSVGDCRYEATLNWLNDRKAICSAPIFNQTINSLGDLTFTPSRDLMLFGLHDHDGSYIPYCFKIYRAKISEGDQIVRDYVPAFDSFKQKPCMYDLINNVAYYNDGEGEFLYNNDFEGTYEGFGTFATIGNRLGSYTNEDA